MQRNPDTFPKQSFLGSLSLDSWHKLSNLWTRAQYNSGQFLISAEENSSDIFFILRGAARVTTYTANGREVSFATIIAGDSIGEYSAIDNAPRSSSVIATEDSCAARISATQFRNLLETYPDISFNILKIMVAHLRGLSKRVIDFNTKSANLRLQEVLLQLAKQHSRGEDSVLIERPPTQTELAAQIFTSREGVAREMGRLRKAGIITRQKRSLLIPSIEKLRQIANHNP
jgi:CRP-like cAMP-binding protein